MLNKSRQRTRKTIKNSSSASALLKEKNDSKNIIRLQVLSNVVNFFYVSLNSIRHIQEERSKMKSLLTKTQKAFVDTQNQRIRVNLI